MNNQNFFVELLKRIFSKNPKFFKWIQIAAIVLGALSVLFSFLESQSINLPGWAEVVSNAVVKVLAAVTLLLAQLPNQDPAPAASEENKS